MTPEHQKILIIDDEENMRHVLSSILELEGFLVVTAENGQEGLRILEEQNNSLVICDLKMPGIDGIQVLGEIKKRSSEATVIMMSAYATVDTAVSAMKLGAYDFITKPFKSSEILKVITNALERIQLLHENVKLKNKVKEISREQGFSQLVTKSPNMVKMIDFAKRVAQHDSTILITGESGTGKELIARGVQNASKRAEKPFVVVNCAAIPETLLESEFFGYVKGAFTGANSNKKGLFEEADRGTLFLDEIGELPVALQVKLLRVLQEGRVRPIGGKEKSVDVRVLTATARNLEEQVRNGGFRQDLLYRLDVINLKIPPLRERTGDIPLLCNHFLKKHCGRSQAEMKKISSEALQFMQNQQWPGNVRQLENCIEHAVIMSESRHVEISDLPMEINASESTEIFRNTMKTHSLKEGKRIMETSIITEVLKTTQGNKSRAAEMLEISYPALLQKIKKYQIAVTEQTE